MKWFCFTVVLAFLLLLGFLLRRGGPENTALQNDGRLDEVTAAHDMAVTPTQEAAIANRESVNPEIEGPAVAGRVVDTQGHGVAGAMVTAIVPKAEFATVSEAAGSFVVPVPAPVTRRVLSPDHWPALADNVHPKEHVVVAVQRAVLIHEVVVDRSIRSLVIEVAPAGALFGQVVDAFGRPVVSLSLDGSGPGNGAATISALAPPYLSGLSFTAQAFIADAGTSAGSAARRGCG